MNKEPKWYNLKKWRIENGYVTEDWNKFVAAYQDMATIMILLAYAAGILTGKIGAWVTLT